MLASHLLAYPVSYIYRPSDFCGEPLADFYDIDEVTGRVIDRLFNDSLPRIESRLLLEGTDIPGRFGGPEVETRMWTFDGLYRPGNRLYKVRHSDYSDLSRLKCFMAGLYKCCASIVLKAAGESAPTVPPVVEGWVRKIVVSIYGSETEHDYGSGDKHLGAVALREGEDDGVMMPDRGFVECWARDDEDYPSEGFAPFIHSYRFGPGPDHLKGGSRGYFDYWIDEVRHGRYPTADHGYLAIFARQLLQEGEFDPLTLGTLEDMSRAYECLGWVDHMDPQSEQCHFIGRLARDYALIHKKVPDDRLFPSNVSACMCMADIINGGEPKLSNYSLSVMADLPLYSRYLVTDDVNKAFCACMKDISVNLKCNILKACNIYAKRYVTPVLEGLYSREDDKVVFTVAPDLLSSQIFARECGILLKAIIHMCAEGEPKEDPIKVFGIVYSGFVPIVERMLLGPDRVLEKRGEITLDRNAITSAQDDLEETTEMMFIEPGQEAGTGKDSPSPGPPERVKGGWEAFLEGLTSEQADILRRMLVGEAVSMRLSDEEAVNSLAMDTVGDIVLESQSIIEEYEADLRAILGLSERI